MITAFYLYRTVAGGKTFALLMAAVAAVYLAACLLSPGGRTRKGLRRMITGLFLAALPADVGWHLIYLELAPGFESGGATLKIFPAFLLWPLFLGMTFFMVRLLNDLFAE
ncbi:MAG: hypothetical protein IJT76_03085 [Clostridia bacterium]|nr:hypothetical protein [Clostridia bacterium]